MSAVMNFPLPTVDPVAELQKGFALLKLGGQVRLIELPRDGSSWADVGDLRGYAKADGSLVLERALQHVPSAVPPKTAIKDFYAGPDTQVFDAIAFDPRPTPPTTINLWVGPTVVGAPGACPTLEAFLRDVIAAGDVVVYEYLLNFLAHMLQRPEDKPGIMLVLLGGQGTGKGTFFRLLAAIWGRTTIITNQIDQVVGRFNNLLEWKFVIMLDEAMFAGNRDASDKLKSLITEPLITIEAKHETPRQIFSCHRMFAASNHDHFAQTDHDDRRMVYLPIPDTYKGDSAHWTEVNDSLNSAEIPSLVAILRARDISGFNPRHRPKTSALVDQKLRSLSGPSAWWYDILQTQSFGGYNALGAALGICTEMDIWAGPTFVPTSTLVQLFTDFMRSRPGRQRTLTESELKRELGRLCPSAAYTRRQLGGIQRRGFAMPDPQTARADFEKYLGASIPWGL